MARAIGAPLVLGMVGETGAIPLSECANQDAASRALIAQAQADLRALAVPAWAPGAKAGVHLVRVHAAAVSALCVELVGPRGAPCVPFATLAERLLPGREDLALYAGVVSPHHVGQRPRLAHLRGPTAAQTDDELRVTPPAWSAPSPSTGARLVDQTVAWLAPEQISAVLEIGCGVGPLARALTPRVARYLGVDVERAAVLDATANAPGARFRTGDGLATLRRLAASGERFDRVVFHGMRRRFGGPALRLAAALGAERLVYWAPSVERMAEDLAGAPDLALAAWGLLWQMPGTAHALSGALLTPR